MTAQVVYYTQSGNTQKIAQAIAGVAGCSAVTVDTPLTQTVDVLFLGASVYKLGIDKSVLQYIDRLNPAMIGEVVIFSTSAMADSGYSKLVDKLQKRGIAVSNKHFYCKGSFLFMNKNRPNADDVAQAQQFARNILG